MEIVGAALLVFGLLEIGQHVVITPAGIAALAPAIVILVLAAHIEQAVDRARSAQHFAARLEHRPPVEAGLGLGLVHPVDGFFLEQLAVAERHVDPEIGVLRAGLQQQHRMFAVRAQPVGEHASGRSGADDDVVEFSRRHHRNASKARPTRNAGFKVFGRWRELPLFLARPNSAIFVRSFAQTSASCRALLSEFWKCASIFGALLSYHNAPDQLA